MSILIKGMEMPKDVSLWLVIRPDGTVYKIKNGANYGEPQTGKAVTLPEGHGRLGDLDRLFEVMGQDVDRWIVDEVSMIETDDVLDAIHNAPTIVPAEGGTDDDGNA